MKTIRQMTIDLINLSYDINETDTPESLGPLLDFQDAGIFIVWPNRYGFNVMPGPNYVSKEHGEDLKAVTGRLVDLVIKRSENPKPQTKYLQHIKALTRTLRFTEVYGGNPGKLEPIKPLTEEEIQSINKEWYRLYSREVDGVK